MYKVINYFEVITDHGYHLGLKAGDKLHRVSNDKYRLDGTGHTFSIYNHFVSKVS